MTQALVGRFGHFTLLSNSFALGSVKSKSFLRRRMLIRYKTVIVWVIRMRSGARKLHSLSCINLSFAVAMNMKNTQILPSVDWILLQMAMSLGSLMSPSNCKSIPCGSCWISIFAAESTVESQSSSD